MAGEIKHSWNGTVLTIESDSGISSMDLQGPQGDDGCRGPQGPAGIVINGGGGGSVAAANPDWNQNNPSGDGYIQNRTHWVEESGGGEVVYNGTVTLKPLMEIVTLNTPLDLNKTYSFVFDGVDYGTLSPYMADGRLMLGAPYEDYSNIPITVCVGDLEDPTSGGVMWDISGSYNNNSYSLVITCLGGQIYHPLDEKFIPDSIARISDVEDLIGSVNGGGGGGITSGTGANSEIFNDYRERVYDGSTGYASQGNTAEGEFSHAEGGATTASGNYSHAEGIQTTASGWPSHAEGNQTTASGFFGAHAEGSNTTASGSYGSHAEGSDTVARGSSSHAEGNGTTAVGKASHAEGVGSRAEVDYSHAEGVYTTASSEAQHVQGKYNIVDSGTYAHIVGNGTSVTMRSNAHTLDWDGNAWFAGSVEGTAIILTSPNGTRYKITVSDTGTLTATAL